MTDIYRPRRGFIVGAFALGVASAMPARAQDAAIAPIRQLIDGLVGIMKAGGGTPFPARFAQLAPVVESTFDLHAILQESVGPAWGEIPAAQQAMLMDAFRRYTVSSYVNSFDAFDGQRFEISPATRAVGPDVVVRTKIITRTGASHELDYVMRQTGGGWRVVDVLADGAISRVAVQRSDFRRLLERGGAEALAKSLRTKSADLSDGQS